MPPKHVRTVRQLIYWEYAKLIAGRAVGDRKNYRFVTYTYKRLLAGLAEPSAILRENQLLVTGDCCCAYCGSSQDLQWEHIIPRSRGGPDTIDNMVQACRSCNGEKGARDPFEWFGLERRYEVPRIVLGKYLKLVFDFYAKTGTLDALDVNQDGKLDVCDLGSIFISQRFRGGA